MSTSTATGYSTREDAGGAAAEAVGRARDRLRGKQPAFGVVFVSPRHEIDTVLAAACTHAGTSDLIGCTTAGEITETALTHDGIAVMLVASDEVRHRIAYATGMKAEHERVATDLYTGFADTKREAVARGQRHVTSVVLTDGLAGTGEKLVGEMVERSGGAAQIVGGAAGDEARFEGTHVGARG